MIIEAWVVPHIPPVTGEAPLLGLFLFHDQKLVIDHFLH
ncbi:protein of unknown function [Burkholderia multivorans]